MSKLTSEVGENALSVCLFVENPHRLVSLWDMQFAAIHVLQAMQSIAKLETMDVFLDRKPIPSSTFYEEASKDFDLLGEALRSLGLRPQSTMASEMASFMRTHHSTPHRESFAKLVTLVHHDLESFVFEAVPRDRVYYYEVPTLFGEDVHNRFFSAAFDIREAGTCFALGRWTASVFHLMRVLELGLVALAKVFSVPAEHTNWDTIINQIETKVATIDRQPNRPQNWKDDREFYSQCTSHFRVLKDAWRNYTAHARGKYLEGEAYDILTNVKGFMRKLATRLHE